MGELDKRHFQIAMDAIDQIEKTTSAEGISQIVARAVSRFGYEYFCCLMPRNLASPTFESCVLIERWPPGWLDLYRRCDFQSCDPIVRHTRSQVRCTSWAEAPIPDDPVARSIMDIAASEFRLRAGISVPIHGINSYQAGISFAGFEIDDGQDAKSAVELIAIYAVNRISNFRIAAAPPPKKLLTPRQREILLWAAKGKSAWDTGKILGVTEDNVNKLISSAVVKLNAANRTHAVVEAISRREIEI